MMPFSIEAEAPSQAHECPKSWKTFFQLHCDTLFQTALLLSADPEEAEASIAATLDTVDFSQPPSESQVLILQEKLARHTLETAQVSTAPKLSETRSLLQAGLHPVLQIERFPRVCFVLRTLLGYATSTCAQTLGIEEAAVRTLLQIAIVQLQSTALGTIENLSWLTDSMDRVAWDRCLAVGFTDSAAA